MNLMIITSTCLFPATAYFHLEDCLFLDTYETCSNPESLKSL